MKPLCCFNFRVNMQVHITVKTFHAPKRNVSLLEQKPAAMQPKVSDSIKT